MAVKYARRLDLFKKQELGEILKLIEKSDIINIIQQRIAKDWGELHA